SSVRRLTARSRLSSALIVSSTVLQPVHHRGARAVEEARLCRLEPYARDGPDRRRESAAGAQGQGVVADSQIDEGLVAHWLHHVDLAPEGAGRIRLNEAEFLRSHPDLDDVRSDARVAPRRMERNRDAADMQAALIDRGAQHVHRRIADERGHEAICWT